MYENAGKLNAILVMFDSRRMRQRFTTSERSKLRAAEATRELVGLMFTPQLNQSQVVPTRDDTFIYI